ncbi:MAG: UTP--glucose-1-phosphate uridylyltransferase [Planctomycetes bacterium]|nr:UTP--glucose-1-phosphate uridylyltransferase [Planctomycetota bacterium]
MGSRFSEVLTATDPRVRDTSLAELCAPLGVADLLAACDELDAFRARAGNLYERVRATLFLAAIHGYELPRLPELPRAGRLSFTGYEQLLARRYEEAIATFSADLRCAGPSDTTCSALAAAYRGRAFQMLADQVRRSVRSARGNQWMFRVGHPAELPLRIRPELVARGTADAPFPILRERTPVRLDLTHSAWSDIFFLGMDFPEGARVINVSVDLGVRGRDARPEPPIETCLRVIDEPLLRLCSVDLEANVDLHRVAQVFEFARDYLGLLRAGVIAAGLVPPGLEGSGAALAPLLERLCGPGRGLELVTRVRDIPKGSRLAVSTNLLASIIAVCMRATGQTRNLEGPLAEGERRVVASRAILGEWLGGSGGGWQDSGGVWPGLKCIEGRLAQPGDPEFGISRGRLLPDHRILAAPELPDAMLELLQQSLVPLHGGMAQDVGPVLDMVTERYLLRDADAWQGRLRAGEIYDEILAALRAGDLRRLAALTTENFSGPLRAIVPWATNRFTERLIERVRARFGERWLGFCMLGGMAGGGMGMFLDPAEPPSARDALLELLLATKREHERGTPFAMDPVVYDFAIDRDGSAARLATGDDARMAPGYYALVVPDLLRQRAGQLGPARRRELERLGEPGWSGDELRGFLPALFERMLPSRQEARRGDVRSLRELLDLGGFDAELHERIRADLRAGRIGLAQNRLPATTTIEDVRPEDVVLADGELPATWHARGRAALANGEVAVVTLAGGAASRWTRGAGIAKALSPFCRFAGQHRTFLEVHVAKTRRVADELGVAIPHVVTTSLFTHDAIAAHVEETDSFGYRGPLLLSPGRAVGLRMVPTVRDLVFLYEERARQLLDEQAQKVRESLQSALIDWARSAGEGADYVDNLPLQCLHPVGHWFEIPNLLRNGVLADLFDRQPRLRYLLIHNIDTVGADLDPARLGLHVERGAGLTFEVIPRRIDDVGGGLARVDGRPRLLEGLAMPDDETEFRLSHYNTGTTWVDVQRLLEVFGLAREDLRDAVSVGEAVRRLAARVPTYVTVKDVKRRWGRGQEDVFPVAQFEKLWGDMTLLPEFDVQYHVVPRRRGQQLKEPAQLDAFVRDGSAAFIESLCRFA